MQTKYGIAKMLAEYEMTVNAKTKVPLQMKKTSVTVEADGGIYLDYIKIQ